MSKTKDPALLWYVNDWIGGTRLMSFPHMGAYMELLMGQFQYGHLTMDNIVHLLRGDISLWENCLKEKFVIDANGLYYNEKMDRAINERLAYKQNRLANLKGKTSPHMDTPYAPPECGNGNEDGDIDANNKKKDKYLDFVYLTKDEYSKLKVQFPDIDKRIQRLNDYIGSTGRKYKSHYHTILSWANKEEKQKRSSLDLSGKNYREGME